MPALPQSAKNRNRPSTHCGFEAGVGHLLVLFDVKVKRDQVRFFTLTAEPVARADGGPAAYGCTEFVFQLVSTPSTSKVFGSIDRVLAVQAR